MQKLQKCITYKILTSLLLRRVEVYMEKEICKYQSKYKQGKSTINAVNVVKQMVEKCYERDIEIHIVLVDFLVFIDF